MSTTSEQQRAWTGPALFTYGFRPFFLGGALWAACAMVLWVLMLGGHRPLPIAWDPVSWHAHAFLFGYLGAVIAGFMMTAVPNWTGRLPIVGWPLAGLWALWLMGRAAVALSDLLPAAVVAGADLAFPVVLAAAMTREIIAGKNWKNLTIIGLLAVFTLANLLFHLDAASGAYAAAGVGMRLGLAAAITMIALIGGRIVPSFTRNWLAKHDHARLPTPPMQRFDKVSMLGLVVVLATWVLAPTNILTSLALLIACALHAARLVRWRGIATTAEPLLLVLHLAYALVPLGALMLSVSGLWPSVLSAATAQHVWMAGAVGLMTLAVMSRASLGHTGHALHAGPGTVAIYSAIVTSVFARIVADMIPALQHPLHITAAVFWVLAFGGFAVIYGPLLTTARAR